MNRHLIKFCPERAVEDQETCEDCGNIKPVHLGEFRALVELDGRTVSLCYPCLFERYIVLLGKHDRVLAACGELADEIDKIEEPTS